jgi:hypothetical protein
MFRAWFPSATAFRLSAAAVVLTLACNAAQAQVKPFRVSGGGPAPEGFSIFGADSPHSATGRATFLGRYSGDDGIAIALSFDPATGSGTFKGSFTFVAANGDKLACTYGDPDNGAEQVGEFQVYDVGGGNVKVVYVAEFNPIVEKCTGRFKHVVDGSFLMIAMTDAFPLQIDADGFTPPFNYTWEGEGWLKFKKRK